MSAAPLPAEVLATLAAIANTYLNLETLETRKSDRLDFTDQPVWGIRDALAAAFEAGRQQQDATVLQLLRDCSALLPVFYMLHPQDVHNLQARVVAARDALASLESSR